MIAPRLIRSDLITFVCLLSPNASRLDARNTKLMVAILISPVEIPLREGYKQLPMHRTPINRHCAHACVAHLTST